jgi:perosamine synthetase
MPRLNWNEPRFEEAEIRAVSDVLRSGFVTEGRQSAELVERLQAFLGVRHVMLTTSGTAALFLAVKADQVIRGLKDFEVLIPDLTFVACPNSVELAGGTPVLVEVERERMCIDVDDARRKISAKTKAIMPVHVFGRGCEMDRIHQLARDYDLLVIEDAANALGSSAGDGMLGAKGDIGCFSLQANKTITCGHGGFVATDNSAYHEVMVRLKDFGRFSKEEDIYPIAGYNFKFNDVLAAIALEQFRRIGERTDALRAQRQRYEANLGSCGGVHFLPFNYVAGEIPQYVDVMVENRPSLRTFLAVEGIGTRECWQPLHRNPPYQDRGTDSDFPVACELSAKCTWLPNGRNITLDNIDHVCERISAFYESGSGMPASRQI